MQSFNEMLSDVYFQFDTTMSEETKLILPNPELEKSTTRILWKPKSFLDRIQNPKEHFYEFISRETGKKINWVSNCISDGIIIHAKKISQNDIINLMKKYVDLYVLCKICKSSQTEMQRDTEIKKYRIKCIHCNSEYTV
jgi:translation initiation factor 2 beta subunit (eIF-2beta)/eIF-5